MVYIYVLGMYLYLTFQLVLSLQINEGADERGWADVWEVAIGVEEGG